MPVSPDVGSEHAAPVVDLLTAHELDLLEQAAKALRGDQTSAEWARIATTRIARWRAAAERGTPGAAQRLLEAVREALAGAAQAGAEEALHGLPDVPSVPPVDLRGVHLSAENLGRELATALQQVPRMLELVLREAVRAGADEVHTGRTTRRGGSQQVLDRLIRNGVTGFRDSAGRNWSLTSYAEMAVRTETQRVALEAGAERIKALGLALVVVSDSPRECPLCRPFEGKVLSLGPVVDVKPPKQYGKDTQVPQEISDILDKWVQLRGSGLLTEEERRTLATAVEKYGQKAPRLYRGVDGKASYKRGEALELGPSSTSQDMDAASPYAEGNEHPTVFIFDDAKGLNVQERAEAVAGYGEKEWITKGKFYVTRVADGEDFRQVHLSTRPPAARPEATRADRLEATIKSETARAASPRSNASVKAAARRNIAEARRELARLRRA